MTALLIALLAAPTPTDIHRTAAACLAWLKANDYRIQYHRGWYSAGAACAKVFWTYVCVWKPHQPVEEQAFRRLNAHRRLWADELRSIVKELQTRDAD